MLMKYIRIYVVRLPNFSKAEQFCCTKALRARRHSKVTRGVGETAAGTAIALGTAGTVTTVGVGISIFARFATFGIGTLVGLGN